MSTYAAVEDALLKLIKDYRDMNGTRVPTLDTVPTALEFARAVHLGRPFVINDYASQADVPASRWTTDTLRKTMGHSFVTVSVTPSGNADALVDHEGTTYFVEPLNEQMTMNQFLARLRAGTDGEVLYLQSQNGNLHDPYNEESEFASIRGDVPRSVPFMDEALGKEPDAVNIWIGGSASVTSLHKDPYENVYLVINGSKTFTLLPPHEGVLLETKLYPHASYTRSSPASPLTLTPSSSKRIPWTPIDPTLPTSEQRPLFASHAAPLTVRVEAGDALFLPSGWWHHVQQENGRDGSPCIALNWWSDQAYDGSTYVLRTMVERMARSVGWLQDRHVDEEDDDDTWHN